MKYLLFLSAALLLFTGCNQSTSMHRLTPREREARMDSLKSDLLKTDVTFAQMSVDKGRNAAFIAYADSNATVLRPFSMPLTGRDTIAKLFSHFPDSTCTLTWMPISADVSRSGDMGYTYGTYSFDLKGVGKEEGSYCTVWKKDKNHQWKFVMDVGNRGLKEEDKEADQKMEEARKEAKKKG